MESQTNIYVTEVTRGTQKLIFEGPRIEATSQIEAQEKAPAGVRVKGKFIKP